MMWLLQSLLVSLVSFLIYVGQDIATKNEMAISCHQTILFTAFLEKKKEPNYRTNLYPFSDLLFFIDTLKFLPHRHGDPDFNDVDT